VFTQETGISIKEYYQKKRFEEAVEMLKGSNFSITQIAQDLQYKSIHTFSRAFRKNFGISPTAYHELYSKMDVGE
jgi:AraC-like DNA-binding protein